MIKSDFAQVQHLVKVKLKEMAEQAKITDQQTTKRTDFYQQQHEHQSMVPNPLYPWPTKQLRQLEQQSESDARKQLYQLQEEMRLQKYEQQMRDIRMQKDFDSKLTKLQNQQSSNQLLLLETNEASKREKVLKSELLHSQECLSVVLRELEMCKAQLHQVQSEKNKLLKIALGFKQPTKQVQQLATPQIDIPKLLSTLKIKDTELNQLRHLQTNHQKILSTTANKHYQQLKNQRNQLQNAHKINQNVIARMEIMRSELEILEKQAQPHAWQTKCYDLFKTVQALQDENRKLRNHCQDLIDYSIALLDQIHTAQETTKQEQSMMIYGSLSESKPLQRSLSSCLGVRQNTLQVILNGSRGSNKQAHRLLTQAKKDDPYY